MTGPPVIADLALRGRHGMVTGANTDDLHLRGVDVDRDIHVSMWADLRVELVGIPYRVTVGVRGLADGTVDLVQRASGDRETLPVAAAADRIPALVTAASA